MQYHQPGRFARTMKALVSLLWSSSLLRNGCSQWLMVSSESPKGPSSYSVLPEEAVAWDLEQASQMRQLRRTSRTCKKIGMVFKEKTIACTEEKKAVCEYRKNSVMPKNTGHLWSQWEAVQVSMMLVISISGTASGGSRTKAFSVFPLGGIGLRTPWLVVSLKYHVPTDTIFSPQEGGSSVEEVSLVSSLWRGQRWMIAKRWRLFTRVRGWSFRSLLEICLCRCSQSTWEGTTMQQKT